MIDPSIINPYIRLAMPSILPRHTTVARRILFDYELIYLEDGEVLLQYNETDHRCQKGQFLLIRPGIPHSLSVTESELSQPHIHFDITHYPDSHQVPVCFKDLPDMTAEERCHIRPDLFLPYPPTPFVAFSQPQAALRLFYAIVNPPKSSPLVQKGLMIQLIDMMIADNFSALLQSHTERAYPVEEQIKDYFDAGQGLTSHLDDLAKQFNYSKCHLEHRFQSRYGIGLIAYRNHKRMEIAKTLLQTHSVSQVATRLGFSSIYVFSRSFKHHFGLPPSNLKRME